MIKISKELEEELKLNSGKMTPDLKLKVEEEIKKNVFKMYVEAFIYGKKIDVDKISKTLELYKMALRLKDVKSDKIDFKSISKISPLHNYRILFNVVTNPAQIKVVGLYDNVDIVKKFNAICLETFKNIIENDDAVMSYESYQEDLKTPSLIHPSRNISDIEKLIRYNNLKVKNRELNEIRKKEKGFKKGITTLNKIFTEIQLNRIENKVNKWVLLQSDRENR